MTDDAFVVEASFAQEGMWLQHQLDPDQPTCNISAAARVRGPLRTDALHRALNSIIDRQESLRTTFRMEDGVLMQVVKDRLELPMPVSEIPPSHVRAAARRLVETPFDVERGPLLRMHVFELGRDDNVLVLVMHHLVMDGWSAALMFRELSAFYESFVGGPEPDLPELEIQYADYAVWQREELSGAKLAELEGYWTGRLAGAQPLLLPADRPVPAVRSSAGETAEFGIPAELVAALERLAREQRGTLFMVLLAALQTLLSRYSGQRDIVITTPVAGRNRAEVVNVIGDFLNMLVLRTEVLGELTVAELIARCRDTCLGAYAHQDMPLVKVLDGVEPAHADGAAGNSLVRAMLVLQNMPTEPWVSGDLVFEPIRLDSRTSMLDMSITVEGAEGGGQTVLIEYSTDLFDRETIDLFGRSYVEVLEAFVMDPRRRTDRIELRGDRDRLQALHARNATGRERPDGLVHELIDRQAERRPAAVAVEDPRDALSYAELRRRTDELAAFLRSCPTGDAPHEPAVAIAMNPSVHLAVAVLGTLKSGRAFVPLDPRLPPRRLAEMARDACARVVLTEEALSGELDEVFGGCEVIRLDRDEVVPGPDGAVDRSLPHAAGLACVLYTSGSTSRPKGVMFEHGALADFAVHIGREFGLTERDRYFQLSSIGFDTFLEELFAPLVAGATVVLPGERILASGADLTAHVERQRITVVDLTPAYWHEWTRELAGRGGPPDPLRLAVVGGDRMLPESVEKWLRFGTGLIEVYGLTETTVTATVSDKGGDRAGGEPPPAVIGTPLANARVYVLDHCLRPVAPGAVGEIHIGGACLARGYLNDPALTAERFVADPFGAPGSRMLRTGDLARLRRDGGIEFLGRVDHQVKIRGHRVEPGEVEEAVASHPDVAQAAVLSRDGNGGKRLVAYAAPVPGADLDPEALRAFIGTNLPEFLIPAVVVVAAMPMTSSGKIDRRALAEIEAPAWKPSRAPATAREELLCRLFAEVAGIERAGAEDDFFSMGGDSITAIQLASSARSAGLPISARDVFTHRTAARLAAAAEDGAAARADVVAPVGPMPLTPAAAWLAELGAASGTAGVVVSQAMVLKVPPHLDKERLIRALQRVIDHHDALRTNMIVDGGTWQTEIAEPGTVHAADWFSRTDVAGLPPRRLRESVIEQARRARRRLESPEAGMGRLVWFDAGEDAGRLMIMLNHLAVDGVSWRILLPDLALAYGATGGGEPGELQDVGTSFRQWAHDMADVATSPSALRELGIWQDIVRTPDPLLGTRQLDPALDTEDTSRYFTVTVPPEVAAPLLSGTPASAGRPGPDAMLLTGLARAVGAWRARRGGHGSAVLLQIERHGREEQIVAGADLSRTVGWFTSSFPVALDPGSADPAGGTDAGSEAAAAVRRVAGQLRAIPDNGIRYGLLRYLNPETAGVLTRTPGPQIGFNHLGRIGSGDAGADGWGLDVELTTAMGSGLSAHTPLPHALQVTAVVENLAAGPALSATWQWASRVLAEEDVRELAREWSWELSVLAGQSGKAAASPGMPRQDGAAPGGAAHLSRVRTERRPR